ncbi:hypothetical protein F5Y17DRAFT_214685 [Xylariaceae sp. FL0594]|nr:hypothetical protein F5Y17DRAFT_214685 [Xylariaceae sp. FL0594]
MQAGCFCIPYLLSFLMRGMALVVAGCGNGNACNFGQYGLRAVIATRPGDHRSNRRVLTNLGYPSQSGTPRRCSCPRLNLSLGDHGALALLPRRRPSLRRDEAGNSTGRSCVLLSSAQLIFSQEKKGERKGRE